MIILSIIVVFCIILSIPVFLSKYHSKRSEKMILKNGDRVICHIPSQIITGFVNSVEDDGRINVTIKIQKHLLTKEE